MNSFDVIVVGAGTAGAAAAASLAERGLRTLCLDVRPLEEAGARWVNGVAGQAFVDAGVPLPSGAELRSKDHRFHLVCGWGPERLTLEGHGVLDVDMRLLVRRLQDRARQAGATLMGGVRTYGLRGNALATSNGELRARWYVDASGLTGANLLGAQPVAREDLCAAAQEVRRVSDMPAALAFFERHGVAKGDALCFASVAGGYSIVNVRLEDDEISILTGSIPALGHPSGQKLIDDFAAKHAFVGARVFGGARAVPLARPRTKLVSGRVIAIGDAANQVFSAHGSGIGIGMIAGRMVAEALVREDPDSYATQWQRRYGGIFAAYDVFRRFSQTLRLDEVRQMMTSGLLNEDSAVAAMQQRLPTLGPSQLLGRLDAMRKVPRLALRFAPMLARMTAMLALYQAYPTDPKRVGTWAKLVARF